MNDKIKAIVTIIATGITFVNTILTMKGINPIPFSEDAFYQWASVTVNGIAIIVAWWKNQNITKNAQASQKLLDHLKGKDGKEIKQDNSPEGV